MAGEQLREMTDGDFDLVLSTVAGPVLVEFFATWCGACRRLAPTLDAVAGEFAGRVEVMKLNADDNPETVNRYGVSSTPTLILFASGRPAARLVGAQREAPLRTWLAEALAQDTAATTDGSPGWAPGEACTLPTAAQPLRVAEFGDLFAASLRGILRRSPTRLQLELDAEAEVPARDLTARESECCGFFSFTFSPAAVGPAEAGTVLLEVEVPASRVEALDGLAAQALAARAA